MRFEAVLVLEAPSFLEPWQAPAEEAWARRRTGMRDSEKFTDKHPSTTARAIATRHPVCIATHTLI